MLTRSDDLEILLVVADTGGFSSAAESLDIQVAKVSRAVSRIEHQLSAKVFNRTTRRVELTEEGQLFIQSVRVGLGHIEQAEELLKGRGTKPAGRLRVDAASPFVLHQLVPHIQPFKDEYPEIHLELSSNEGFVDLLEQRADIAIRIGALEDSTLTAKTLGRSQLFIVASPDYLVKQGTPKNVADFQTHTLLGFSGNRTLNRWPLESLDIIEPDIACTNGEIIRQLALNGNGIACLSGFMVNQDLKAGRLVPILNSEKLVFTERETVSAVFYKSSSATRRIQAFIEFILPRLEL